MTDDCFDLIVWYEPGGDIYGFQLCYDKQRQERALTWTHERGFTHTAVDSGEAGPVGNLTPILLPARTFQAAPVRKQFEVHSANIDETIRKLVLAKIDEYAAIGKSAA